MELKAPKCLLIGRDRGASPLIKVLFNSSKVRRTLSSTNPSISKTCGIQEYSACIAIHNYISIHVQSYYNNAADNIAMLTGSLRCWSSRRSSR